MIDIRAQSEIHIFCKFISQILNNNINISNEYINLIPINELINKLSKIQNSDFQIECLIILFTNYCFINEEKASILVNNNLINFFIEYSKICKYRIRFEIINLFWAISRNCLFESLFLLFESNAPIIMADIFITEEPDLSEILKNAVFLVLKKIKFNNYLNQNPFKNYINLFEENLIQLYENNIGEPSNISELILQIIFKK